MINDKVKQKTEKCILQHMMVSKLYVSIVDSKLSADFFSQQYKDLYIFLISYYHINNDIISNPYILGIIKNFFIKIADIAD